MIQFNDYSQLGLVPLDADGITRTCLPLGNSEGRLVTDTPPNPDAYRDLLFASRFAEACNSTMYDLNYIQYDPQHQVTRIISQTPTPWQMGGPLPTGTDPVTTPQTSTYNSDGCADSDTIYITEYMDSD